MRAEAAGERGSWAFCCQTLRSHGKRPGHRSRAPSAVRVQTRELKQYGGPDQYQYWGLLAISTAIAMLGTETRILVIIEAPTIPCAPGATGRCRTPSCALSNSLAQWRISVMEQADNPGHPRAQRPHIKGLWG